MVQHLVNTGGIPERTGLNLRISIGVIRTNAAGIQPKNEARVLEISSFALQ
jgi:hypothetical protein